MKVYVAGGSDERIQFARVAIDRLSSLGFTITHDWTRCEGYDREHTDAERAEWATQDMVGVMTADVVWVMVPTAKSEGAAAELGAAVALGKKLVVSGRRSRGNIFSTLAAQVHLEHEDAFCAILAMREELRIRERQS